MEHNAGDQAQDLDDAYPRLPDLPRDEQIAWIASQGWSYVRFEPSEPNARPLVVGPMRKTSIEGNRLTVVWQDRDEPEVFAKKVADNWVLVYDGRCFRYMTAFG